LHDHADRLPEEQRQALLLRIVTNTRRLSEFVENLLQFARIESDELHLDRTPFDLAGLVRRTVGEFQANEPERTFVVDVADDLPAVLGDESRQWQVLVNLVSNAVKYSPPDAPVEVRAAVVGDEVEVSVADRGAGIAPDELSRLFGKFSRVGSAGTGKKAMGTGLGLYICRSLVEAHGGTIRVESTVGEGTTFTYTVPLADGGGD
jgi:two-component system sensor histidine kinase KdpD